MKNKLLLGALLIGTASLFTSCKDDKDSNPSLIQPTEFTLNTPAYSNETVDLQATDMLPLSWSQPKYTADNAPVNATYEIQVSPTNKFTVSTDEAEADEDGLLVADYAILSRTTQFCTYSLIAEDLNLAILKLEKWTEQTLPAVQDVYIRVSAYIAEPTTRKHYPIASNSIKIQTAPYYIELRDAEPILWYMVGNCIGSAQWSNDANGVGKGLVPLFIQADEAYDKVTGTGVTSFTGFFPAGGQFKFIREPGSWDDQMTYDDVVDPDGSFLSDEDGGNHNLGINVDGYYTIQVDSKDRKVTVKKYEGNVAVYNKLCVAGTFNDWTDSDMTPVFTLDGVENHIWSYEVNGGDKLKVKIAGDWSKNWGYKNGLAGSGDNDGNLVVPDGSYLMLFNDITGDYMLIKK